jgi:hypothetical protein
LARVSSADAQIAEHKHEKAALASEIESLMGQLADYKQKEEQQQQQSQKSTSRTASSSPKLTVVPHGSSVVLDALLGSKDRIKAMLDERLANSAQPNALDSLIKLLSEMNRVFEVVFEARLLNVDAAFALFALAWDLRNTYAHSSSSSSTSSSSSSTNGNASAADDDPENVWKQSLQIEPAMRSRISDQVQKWVLSALCAISDALAYVLVQPLRAHLVLSLKGGNNTLAASTQILRNVTADVFARMQAIVPENERPAKLVAATKRVVVAAVDAAMGMVLATAKEVCTEDCGMVLKVLCADLQELLEAGGCRSVDSQLWFVRSKELSNLLVIPKRGLDAAFICGDLCPHVHPLEVLGVLANFNAMQKQEQERAPANVLQAVRSVTPMPGAQHAVVPGEVPL